MSAESSTSASNAVRSMARVSSKTPMTMASTMRSISRILRRPGCSISTVTAGWNVDRRLRLAVDGRRSYLTPRTTVKNYSCAETMKLREMPKEVAMPASKLLSLSTIRLRSTATASTTSSSSTTRSSSTSPLSIRPNGRSCYRPTIHQWLSKLETTAAWKTASFSLTYVALATAGLSTWYKDSSARRISSRRKSR